MPDIPLACKAFHIEKILTHRHPEQFVFVTADLRFLFKCARIDFHIAVVKRLIKCKKACERDVLPRESRFFAKLSVCGFKVVFAVFYLSADEV